MKTTYIGVTILIILYLVMTFSGFNKDIEFETFVMHFLGVISLLLLSIVKRLEK